MSGKATPEAEAAVEAATAGWGAEAAAALVPRLVKFHWFTLPDGQRLTHLDITGGEALALEAELGVEWGDLRPKGSLAHHMGFLRVFLARSDPDGAKGASRVVAAMTVAQIEATISTEWGAPDDLPDGFEDGLPKAAKAAP